MKHGLLKQNVLSCPGLDLAAHHKLEPVFNNVRLVSSLKQVARSGTISNTFDAGSEHKIELLWVLHMLASSTGPA